MTSKKLTAGLIAVLLMLGVSITVNVALLSRDNDETDQETVKISEPEVKLPADNGFQAVFLTNGQVYFGKLSAIDKENYQLTRVYYLGENGELIKLGKEDHKPKDVMYIPRQSLSFWENLKDSNQFDGKLR